MNDQALDPQSEESIALPTELKGDVRYRLLPQEADRDVMERAGLVDRIGLKFQRGQRLFESIDLEINAYLDERPYTLFSEQSKDDRFKFSARVKLTEHPSAQIALLVGDALHNFRSALDHLVWALALKTTTAPHRRTEFPIFDSAASFMREERPGNPSRGSGLDKLSCLEPAPQPVIEQLQPYHSANPTTHPLWLLHELSNEDKHQVLAILTTGFNLANVVVENGTNLVVESFEGPQPRSFDGELVAQALLSKPDPIQPSGGELNWWVVPRVSFDPKGRGQGLAVLDVLADIRLAVAECIVSLSQFL